MMRHRQCTLYSSDSIYNICISEMIQHQMSILHYRAAVMLDIIEFLCFIFFVFFLCFGDESKGKYERFQIDAISPFIRLKMFCVLWLRLNLLNLLRTLCMIQLPYMAHQMLYFRKRSTQCRVRWYWWGI